MGKIWASRDTLQTMKREYDAHIVEHYRSVAESDGLSPKATMADEITRRLETEAITTALDEMVVNGLRSATIVDVGCGNGYTIAVLAERHPGFAYIGVEYSIELRSLAQSRFLAAPSVSIRAGDIRDARIVAEPVDFLLCQRVLINLLDPADQACALDNLCAAVKPGGTLLFIEAFQSGLERLNKARREFELPPIPPAHHNLYLADDFFERGELVPRGRQAERFLSTHYFVTRVLHPAISGSHPFIRNSEFVRFFSEALPPAIGDYAPLRLKVFQKVGQ
jgi:SAM-dependent methyltransferase